MKREHPVATSLAAAVAAALLVLFVYKMQKTHNAPDAPPQTPVAALPPPAATQHAVALPPFTARAAPQNAPSGARPELPPALRDRSKPPQLPANLPAPEELREQFNLLRRFLELPPERLAKIRESIERIESMSPERKSMLLARIQNVNTSGPESALRPRSLLADAAADIRQRVSRTVAQMPTEARNALMEKLRNYSPEQRAAFFEGMAQGLSEGTMPDADTPPWSRQGDASLFDEAAPASR
jgi:type IV secretory pathway VirB10-like protein